MRAIGSVPGLPGGITPTAVPLVTPPPLHFVNGRVKVIVFFVSVVVRPGETLMLPPGTEQLVPPAAPAGDATNPIDSSIAAANSTPATLRMQKLPSSATVNTESLGVSARESHASPQVIVQRTRKETSRPPGGFERPIVLDGRGSYDPGPIGGVGAMFVVLELIVLVLVAVVIAAARANEGPRRV